MLNMFVSVMNTLQAIKLRKAIRYFEIGDHRSAMQELRNIKTKGDYAVFASYMYIACLYNLNQYDLAKNTYLKKQEYYREKKYFNTDTKTYLLKYFNSYFDLPNDELTYNKSKVEKMVSYLFPV